MLRRKCPWLSIRPSLLCLRFWAFLCLPLCPTPKALMLGVGASRLSSCFFSLWFTPVLAARLLYLSRQVGFLVFTSWLLCDCTLQERLSYRCPDVVLLCKRWAFFGRQTSKTQGLDITLCSNGVQLLPNGWDSLGCVVRVKRQQPGKTSVCSASLTSSLCNLRPVKLGWILSSFLC